MEEEPEQFIPPEYTQAIQIINARSEAYSRQQVSRMSLSSILDEFRRYPRLGNAVLTNDKKIEFIELATDETQDTPIHPEDFNRIIGVEQGWNMNRWYTDVIEKLNNTRTRQFSSRRLHQLYSCVEILSNIIDIDTNNNSYGGKRITRRRTLVKSRHPSFRQGLYK